jgi:hypothetical protein
MRRRTAVKVTNVLRVEVRSADYDADPTPIVDYLLNAVLEFSPTCDKAAGWPERILATAAGEGCAERNTMASAQGQHPLLGTHGRCHPARRGRARRIRKRHARITERKEAVRTALRKANGEFFARRRRGRSAQLY